jgi:hypothetical protein
LADRIESGQACFAKAGNQENSMSGKAKLLESGLVLALMGILAGAIGGLAVGLVTAPKATYSNSAR